MKNALWDAESFILWLSVLNSEV